MSASQLQAADELANVLLDTRKSLNDEVEALQNFAWELIIHKSTERWSNIYQFFVAIMALRIDGTYTCAANLSPDISKLTYLIRTTCMAETLNQPEDSQLG